jgi:hypothetical protein
MTTYERLEQSTYDLHIKLETYPLPVLNGFYFATPDFASITLSTALKTTCERCCVLAEELGHHHTQPPDLFIASKAIRDKYEYLATQWAVNELVPLPRLIDAWNAGIRDSWDLAEYLDVTEPFIQKAVDLLEEHYGPCARCGKYYIHFRPMEIREVS